MRLISSFWLCVWSGALSLAWLMPNHYRPWLSFHADAWTAAVLLTMAVFVIGFSRLKFRWDPLTLSLAILACVPCLQYAFGLTSQGGTVWVISSYLIGLWTAIQMGILWEENSPGQAGDGFFLAIGMASIFSVGLQLQQWLELDGLFLWTMGGDSVRPYANLGQSNQLGTLLLWGLLATIWGFHRNALGSGTALLLSSFLLFGVALTGSRTAWLNVAMLVIASWSWRRIWCSAKLPWLATVLGLYFVACVIAQSWLRHQSQGSTDAFDIENVTRMGGELRPMAWLAFLDAVWQRPWFGYGWGQVAMAQMAVAIEHPNLRNVFSYSHNVFLDLVLWCGLPIGLLVSGASITWVWRKLGAIKTAEDGILILVLVVVGVHAMVELPLYFGYFLFPLGVVVGAINTRIGSRLFFETKLWFTIAWLFITAFLLSVIIRDYFRVEASYQSLRMEWMSFKITMPVRPPDVLILTQWHEYIQAARKEPMASMSPEELKHLQAMIALQPNQLVFRKIAMALALNQRPEEATLWLRRMCKVIPAVQCLEEKRLWQKHSLLNPELAAISWSAEK